MFPQLPQTVSHLMHKLTSGLRKTLGSALAGVYLGGSAAAGEFCEATSDLDFLVVTNGTLSLEDALAVELMHRDLMARYPLAARLEGDYAPRHALIPQGTSEPVPGCEKGVFLPRVGDVVLSAAHIRDMRENGLSFFGPQVAEMLPAVTAEQMCAAVRELLSHGLGPCRTAQDVATEALNLIRSLYTLHTGKPITKPAGAAWALNTLEEPWHPVIHAALAVRSGYGVPADEALLRSSLPALERLVKATLS